VIRIRANCRRYGLLLGGRKSLKAASLAPTISPAGAGDGSRMQDLCSRERALPQPAKASQAVSSDVAGLLTKLIKPSLQLHDWLGG